MGHLGDFENPASVAVLVDYSLDDNQCKYPGTLLWRSNGKGEVEGHTRVIGTELKGSWKNYIAGILL